MTNVKTNLKGKYDSLECRACKNAEESQKHVVQECQSLNEDTENIEYEKIFNGSVLEKLKVARKFQQNYQKLEERKS